MINQVSKWDKVAVGIALGSLAVSLAVGIFSYLAQEEATAVELSAAASINSFGSTPAGYAVQTSFINNSLRPVIVRSIELTVGGTPVAPITSYLLDNRAGADASSLGDEPLEDGRPLPFALSARGALTLTGFADFADVSHVSEKERKRWRERALALCGQLENTSQAEAPPVRLQIKIEPEETLTTPVRIDGPVGDGNTWNMQLTGPKAGPTGLRFWRYTASPTALRLLTVKVWRQHGGVKRWGSLPVVGAGSAELTFLRLRRGSYRAALMSKSEVLASGRFHVPLLEPNESVYPSDAQFENGQCLQLKGGRDIFSQPRARYEHPKGG